MAAPKPLFVIIVAFLFAAAAAIQFPDSTGQLPPYTLHPADAPANLPPFTLLPADPAAAMSPPGLGKGPGHNTMSAESEQVRRRVYHQQRDSVPCSRRGASYYNCRPAAGQDSPYHHACSRIKHCHD